MAPQADYLILKRRAQEEDRMTYETVCANNFKAASNAEWEIKTQGFIEHQMATNDRTNRWLTGEFSPLGSCECRM